METFALRNKRVLVSRKEVTSRFFQVPKLQSNLNGYDLYYADRKGNQSSIKRLSLSNDLQLKESEATTVFTPSEIKGTFDDEGVMPACLLTKGGDTYMFYSGWNTRNTVPYHNATGLASISQDGMFVRDFLGPVLDRQPDFPFLAVTPTVWVCKDLYHCIYVNGDGWLDHMGKTEALYSMRYAVSTDLKNWERFRHCLIEEPDGRICHSNPCQFWMEEERYIAYCSRNPIDFRSNQQNGYMLKIAKWDSKKLTLTPCEVVIDADPIAGFDDQMMAYPEILETPAATYMLYNGNGFGRTGIGIMELEKI